MVSKFITVRMISAIMIVLTMSFALPTITMAMSLQDAKAMGAIGERQNGYLGIVNSAASAEAKAVVTDVNSRRKIKYQEIAKRNNTSVSAIEKLAGKKAVSKTLAGQYIQSPSGKWVKK